MNLHPRTITVVALLSMIALGALALTGLWHPNAPTEAMKVYLPQITLATVIEETIACIQFLSSCQVMR